MDTHELPTLEIVVLPLNTQLQPQVMVHFGDGKHAFVLKEGATLIDLAESIDELEAQHGTAPVSIQIAFSSGGSRAMLPKFRNQNAH